MQSDHVLKDSPCEFQKANLDMVEEMLQGDLLEPLKLWKQTEANNEVEVTFEDKGMDKKYKKKVK